MKIKITKLQEVDDPKHPNNILEKCIHCGFKTTLPLIRRWHNDNCKNKS